MKNRVHSKEKARLKAIFDDFVHAQRISLDHASRVQEQHSRAEATFQRRCRTVMRRAGDTENTLPIYLDGNLIRYYPRLGKLVWHQHSDKSLENEDATREGRSGARVVSGAGGRPYAAARLCYEAIHGEIPEGHVVYCADANPLNLVATNLRCVRHRVEPTPKAVLDEKTRDFLRARREAREAKAKADE